jgi:2-dehydropantoate 2-reductase
VTETRLSIAVLGPGGVGGLLAAVLARAGDSVLVLAGDETARAIAERGLDVESQITGNFHASVETATRLSAPVDACLVTVKATQLSAATLRVPAEAIGDSLVVPFLNGMEHVDKLRAIYTSSNVIAATIAIESVRVGPGSIRQLSPFARVEFAATGRVRDRIEPLASHIAAAGLDVRIRDDERRMLWDKFGLLAPMALLTTHERANMGQVRSNRRDDLIALIDEIAAVANADGGLIDPAVALKVCDSVPPAFETSMQRDQAAGRPLELDALGGALLRRAAITGVPVPVATRLVNDLAARTGVTVTAR